MPTNTNNPSPISSDDPNFASLVEARLIAFDEEYAIETHPAKHRSHLGASAIGEECWRKLWYSFRWVKLQQAEGRMRRLWNRGNREESEFEEFLIWAGVRIQSINPATNKQYVFSKVNGHYGGSTDGIGLITWANMYPIIVEYKTFGSKYFEKLKKEKVRTSNPKYFAQMSSYGAEFGTRHALFGAVNKDTDERYWEFVALDWNYAIELEKKATDIIYSTTPPMRISSQAAFWQCKFCMFQNICHYGEKVEKNCRSCVNAVPTDKGSWTCNKWKAIIPKEAIAAGCDAWEGIV